MKNNIFTKLGKYFSVCALIAIMFAGVSCGRKYNNHYARVLREQRQMTHQKTDSEKVEDQLIRTNQMLAKKEQDQIKSYIDRRGWQMKKLPNGIYVSELVKGTGEQITKNSKVTISYSLDLLNGQNIVPASKPEKKIITMNKQNDIIGLIYVLRDLRSGAKVRTVIPSFMAYGMAGDGAKIPRRSPLVYSFEVLNVK